ncbi:MAG TPA: ferrochelatase, partial [Candidatus Binataceae bacterium]|nr:ferrochelatase [Candidatus Binataceae bacterium]
LARALREALRRDEIEIPVVVGMRTSAPRIEDVLRELQKSSDVRRVFGFVLAAHRCEASWDRYVAAVDAARARIGEGAPEVVYPELWHLHPEFIRALADRTIDALSLLAPVDRARARVLFTAHSVPVAMAGAPEYAEQIMDSARAVAKLIGRDSWTLGWQSRSGNPRDLWLGPHVNDVIRKLGAETVVVVPIGFLCDHVEVLYDLDIDTAGVARAAGVTMVRAATVRDHPEFIAMIAQMTKELVR